MGPRDHPRSRGVYWNPAIHDAKSNGSSPLARGLPAPAERPATGIADHPRSRGVYLWTLESSFAVAGSSPLARGLPGTYHAYGEVDRIIPARAGFTCLVVGVTHGTADHPRSRGVYAAGGLVRVDIGGSSPLARGLLRSFGGLPGAVGIIPARAGFTEVVGGHGLPFWDHPRSRGVYRTATHAVASSDGSSPLARGLPGASSRTFLPPRIIPARAGFTAPGPRRVRVHRDHPRSRGVYRRRAGSGTTRWGSSPLARGLRRGPPARTRTRRIIPARAGFTVPSRTGSAARSDHPRSRGVYVEGREGYEHVKGSSPLARGLLPQVAVSACADRIIPARAGFTAARSALDRSLADHPRSRGVYATLRAGLRPSLGSSPLARGLRRLTQRGGHLERIIPARAGFTCLLCFK